MHNSFRIDSIDIVNYKKYDSLNLKLNQNFTYYNCSLCSLLG